MDSFRSFLAFLGFADWCHQQMTLYKRLRRPYPHRNTQANQRTINGFCRSKKQNHKKTRESTRRRKERRDERYLFTV